MRACDVSCIINVPPGALANTETCSILEPSSSA